MVMDDDNVEYIFSRTEYQAILFFSHLKIEMLAG